MSKKYEDIIINYIMLALVTMNIFSRGSIVLVLFCVFNMFYIKDVKFSFEGVLLIFMSFAMIISILMFPQGGEGGKIIKAFNYSLPYIVGYCGYFKAENKEKYIKRTLFSLYIGYFIHILLTYISNMQVGIEDRQVINIWTGEEVAATLVGLLSAYVIAYAVSSLIYTPGIFIKMMGVAGVIATILVNMQTATRTPFLLMAILIVLLFIMGFAANENRNYSHLLIFAFIGIFLFLLFQINLFGVKTAVMESPLMERFSRAGMETTRGEIAMKYVDQMFVYPWGGKHALEVVGNEAHNLWQQIYDFYGIFAAMILVIVTIFILVKLVQLFMIKYKKPIEYTLVSVYLIVFTQLLLEPVAAGYPILFWTLLLIHGITTGYYKDRAPTLRIERGKFK